MGFPFSEFPPSSAHDSLSKGIMRSVERSERKIIMRRTALNFASIAGPGFPSDSKSCRLPGSTSRASRESLGQNESANESLLLPRSPRSAIRFSNVSYESELNFLGLLNEIETLKSQKEMLLELNNGFAQKFADFDEDETAPCSCVMIDGENVANALCRRHIVDRVDRQHRLVRRDAMTGL